MRRARSDRPETRHNHIEWEGSLKPGREMYSPQVNGNTSYSLSDFQKPNNATFTQSLRNVVRRVINVLVDRITSHNSLVT